MVRPDTVFPDGDFRDRYFAGERKTEVWERVQSIAADIGVPVAEIASVALRFCLSHPAVSTTIAGMRSTGNVERNVEAAEAGPLTDEQLEALRPHRWLRDFYPR
jgi:aryl-alcohol dehydrogenase-like predicted oxidoreductase